MSEDEWQYNTFFRNLLCREEVHLRWENYVSDQVGHYNVVARFNWRARNTLLLRLKLEYCGTILQGDSGRLVEDAYGIGLEVRTAQELLDPSTLITEPGIIRSQADVLCYSLSSELRSALDFNLSFERSGKEPQEVLQLSLSQLVAEDGFGTTVNNGNLDRNSHTPQCDMSFEQWDTDNWWDGYDLTYENPILDFKPEMSILGCDSMRNV